jgi:hypothetical protein
VTDVTLAGVRAKMTRADHHIHDLEEVTSPLRKIAEENIVREDDGDPTKIVYRVMSVPTIDSTAGLIVGDAVHSMRSAFDHLAYQLVLLDGSAPAENSYFPMHGTPLNKKGKPRNVTIAPGIKRQDILDALIAVQPYKRQPGDPWADQLYTINQLDIIDKHHLLLVVVARLDLDNPGWWGLDSGIPSPQMKIRPGPLKSGDPVAWFDFHGTRAPEDFDPHITLAITLDEGPPGHWLRRGPIVDTLRGVRHILTWSRINQYFRPLFPGEPDIESPIPQP